MTSMQVKFDVVSSRNLEDLQSLIETISSHYQLIHLDLVDFNKAIYWKSKGEITWKSLHLLLLKVV